MAKISVKAWKEEGTRLFGEDTSKWRFRCPSCGSIQSPKDFEEYKDKGATPSDAYFSCIGRFKGTRNRMGSKKQPCNYTLGGLINLSKITVVDEKGKEHSVFDFDRGRK